MLFLYFMVGVALAIPEITIVMQFPKLYELMKKYPIFEISFSLGLGVLFAWAMGIQGGVTFAIGNVFGTMITKAIYSMRLIERCRSAKHALAYRKTQAIEVLDTLSDLARSIRFFLGLPRRIIMDSLRGLNTLCRGVRHAVHWRP